jgi:hypothetical protein
MIIIPLYDLCAQNTELAALLTDDIGLKVGEFDANNADRAPYVWADHHSKSNNISMMLQTWMMSMFRLIFMQMKKIKHVY